MLRAYPEYLGERHKGENTLPILIKFIDAKKDLSVQVHPTDEYAQENENGQLGKTEMWYVLDAGREAKLVYGLKQNCTKAEMRRAIADGTVMKYLQRSPSTRMICSSFRPGQSMPSVRVRWWQRSRKTPT